MPQSVASPSSAKRETHRPQLDYSGNPATSPLGRPVGFASPPRDGFAFFTTSDICGRGPSLIHSRQKAPQGRTLKLYEHRYESPAPWKKMVGSPPSAPVVMKKRARRSTYYASWPRLFAAEGPWPYPDPMVTLIVWLLMFSLVAWRWRLQGVASLASIVLCVPLVWASAGLLGLLLRSSKVVNKRSSTMPMRSRRTTPNPRFRPKVELFCGDPRSQLDQLRVGEALPGH